MSEPNSKQSQNGSLLPLTEQLQPENIDLSTSRVQSIVHGDDSEENYETAASSCSDHADSWNADEYVSGIMTKLKKKYNIKSSPSPPIETIDSYEAFKEDVTGSVQIKKKKKKKTNHQRNQRKIVKASMHSRYHRKSLLIQMERPIQMLKCVELKLKKF